ncbi:DUF6417 family protein [Streptomyces sp. NPDC086787]|uniref:DUF6417 family protein n=1 Tax=Streptomyces sp. NPDC086787 TaxID=3365759 RepID=UPI003815172E
MDDHEHIDPAEIAFASWAETGDRLTPLSLTEAHDLLRLLLAAAPGDGRELSAEARRIAKEIAVRVPSEN